MGMKDSAEEMVQLVLMILRALVDRPEEVTVELTQVADTTVLTLRVAIKDAAKSSVAAVVLRNRCASSSKRQA